MELDNNKTNRVKHYIRFTHTNRKVRGCIRHHDIKNNTITLELDYRSMESSPTHNKE